MPRYAEETARGKAVEVASRLRDREDWVLVIGADTVVVRVSHCLPYTPSVYMDCFVTGTE